MLPYRTERSKKMIHECGGISEPVVRSQDSSRFVSRSHLDSMSGHHFDIKTVELWLVSRPLKLATARYTNVWMQQDPGTFDPPLHHYAASPRQLPSHDASPEIHWG